ncbi:MAG: hypothetical protein WAW90_01790, partial [Minisyncoccia bacterium]
MKIFKQTLAMSVIVALLFASLTGAMSVFAGETASSVGHIIFKGVAYTFDEDKWEAIKAILDGPQKEAAPAAPAVSSQLPEPAKVRVRTFFENDSPVSTVWVRKGYSKIPVAHGDTMPVTEGDRIWVSKSANEKGVEVLVGDKPISANQIFNGLVVVAEHGNLLNDTGEMVYVRVGYEAKPLRVIEERSFAIGARISVRTKNGPYKEVTITQNMTVSDVIKANEEPKATKTVARDYSAPVSDRREAVEIVNISKFTLHVTHETTSQPLAAGESVKNILQGETVRF